MEYHEFPFPTLAEAQAWLQDGGYRDVHEGDVFVSPEGHEAELSQELSGSWLVVVVPRS